MTYAETLAHIYSLGRFGIKPGLERITKILAALGNPQDAFAAVHVVGTNGKGSTASFLSSILTAGGYRTGLFTSPHLISFTERIRIDGVEIDEDSVVRLTEKVMEAAPEGATFFEIITALAALYFAEQGVDIAVFEAGMGGRADATNALRGLLSVVTPVSPDHTDYLGSTVAEIADEKCGICKPRTPMVSAPQSAEATTAIARYAREIGSPLYIFGEDFQSSWDEGTLKYRGLEVSLDDVRPGLPGAYQSCNAGVALAAAELLATCGYRVTREALAAGIEGARWPGRMELFQGEPRVLLDGAHNPAGAAALADALDGIRRNRIFLVVWVMGDKDLSGILTPLLPLADQVFAVAPAVERALPCSNVVDFCRSAGVAAVEAGSVEAGMVAARQAAGADDLVVVCGSLYVVGEARSILLSRRFEAFRG